VEKYCRAGQATDDNTAHAHCILDNLGYKHTLRICNTYCFSTATLVARTHLSVTLDVHCVFCSLSLSSSPFLYHKHPCFLCFITDFSHIVSSPIQPEKIGVTYFHCPACCTYDPGPLHSDTPIFLFLYNTQNFPRRLHV
jgi:hypothetical protein